MGDASGEGSSGIPPDPETPKSERAKDQEALDESDEREEVEASDPSPPEPSARASDDPLLDAITNVEQAIARLTQSFDKRFQYDKTKEEAFEHLYEELEEFKRNTRFEVLRPILMDLVLLHDRVQNVHDGIDTSSSWKAGQMSAITASIRGEILEILARQGVEPATSTSSSFDPAFQRAIAVETTDVESEEGSVHQVIRRGFRRDKHILRPEEVIVKKFSAKPGIKSPAEEPTAEPCEKPAEEPVEE